MRLFLQDGHARLQILSRGHVREFRDVGAAKEFLRPLLTSEGNVAAVRNAMGADPVDLVEQLALRIVTEGLQIVSCAENYFALTGAATTATATAITTQTTPLQDEQAAQQEQQPVAEEKHFIEIELIDDEGKPVPNAAYVIELPDGTQRTGRTDGSGQARITGIDPGTAKVSFPEFDKSAYEPGSGGS